MSESRVSVSKSLLSPSAGAMVSLPGRRRPPQQSSTGPWPPPAPKHSIWAAHVGVRMCGEGLAHLLGFLEARGASAQADAVGPLGLMPLCTRAGRGGPCAPGAGGGMLSVSPTGSGRSVAVTAVWQQRGRGPGCSLREGQTASTSEKGPFSGCCWGPPSRTATGRGSNLQAPSEQDPAESQSPALLKGGGLGPAPPSCVLHQQRGPSAGPSRTHWADQRGAKTGAPALQAFLKLAREQCAGS